MSKNILIRRKIRSSKRNKNGIRNLLIPFDMMVQKKRSSNGFWAVRTDHAKTFKNEKGETILLKTGAVIIDAGIRLKDPSKLDAIKKTYQEKIKEIPSNRPIIVDKYSINGIPVEAHTPQKTKMYSESTSGVLAHFYNRPPHKGHDQSPNLKKDFHQSTEYKTAPAITEPVKEQFFTLHKNSGFNQKKRITHYMKISANKYSNAAGYSSPSKRKKRNAKALTKRTEWDNEMEWCHARGHAYHGEDAPSNTSAMRFSVNSRMILHDITLKKLAARHGKAHAHVKFTLKSDGKKVTHIAQRVDYKITVKDVLHLMFSHRNTRRNPHKSEKNYTDAFDAALMEALPAQPKPSTIGPKKSSPLTSRTEYLEATGALCGAKKKISF